MRGGGRGEGRGVGSVVLRGGAALACVWVRVEGGVEARAGLGVKVRVKV